MIENIADKLLPDDTEHDIHAVVTFHKGNIIVSVKGMADVTIPQVDGYGKIFISNRADLQQAVYDAINVKMIIDRHVMEVRK